MSQPGRWDAAWDATEGDPGPARLIASFRRHHPDDDPSAIDQAWRVAARAHHGQRRQSGEPYITHPLAVATIAADLGLDRDTVVAAVLHDTVEDTPVTLADIDALFGADVTRLVDGVTKLDAAKDATREQAKADTLKKMLVALTDDLRVLLLKLCDRTHNMETLFHDGMPTAKRARVATETRDVFVPLAARLGVWELKSRLEDLCFRALDPDGHRQAQLAIAKASPASTRVLAEVTRTLHGALGAAGIAADVAGRTKSLTSAYDKARDRGIDIVELHDLLGARIIVGESTDLYAALGVLHATYPPVPGTFDDYVSTPKHNSYQSLHSTVMGPGGHMIECQVRTVEQHNRAEFGVAAHWVYKNDSLTPDWVSRLAERTVEATDPDEFLAALKADLVRSEVYVFTRDGDALRLPSGATPIDVAYAVHTDVGDHCVGARVNGRARPLRTPLRSGDHVEIVTDDDAAGPRHDWLDAVVTPVARQAIARSLKRRRRAADRDGGLRELRLALGEQGLPETLLSSETLADACPTLRSDADIDALLAAVGTGDVPAGKVVAALVAAGPSEHHVLTVTAVDRVGLLADAATALSQLSVPITAAVTSSASDGLARLTLTIVDHPAQAAAVEQLAALAGVVAVEVS